MLFSSITYLYYFLPAVLLLYFLVPGKGKNLVLLLCSLFFYAWGEPKYVLLMIASIVLFFYYGLAISKCSREKWKKTWLLIAVLTAILELGVFKYADFFLGSINGLLGTDLPLLKLALPIGISFYTFQCLSYVVDVYRGSAEVQRNILSFGTYVSMFPQLIAGPIVRYTDVAKELDQRSVHKEDLLEGGRRFLIGLGKKVLLANQFGQLIEIFRASNEKTVLFYWMYAIGFTLHIYFDFSGYSDMAIGLGRIFGFHFNENFNYPYLSGSISKFWRRWHMSLGGWFRDYVYIPMGGNRVSRGRWVINILTVWMLTGLWHGASWNFVLWGLLYAVVLLAEKWIPALKKLPATIGHGYVLLVVVLGFVLFNAADLRQCVSDLAGLFGFADIPAVNAETWYYLQSYGVLFLLGVVGATPLLRNLVRKARQTKIACGVLTVLEPLALMLILLLCSAFLVDGSFNPFLYFRF